MRTRSPTLALSWLAAVALSWAPTTAAALQSCTKDADCKVVTDACHAGTCIPKSKLCTSTAGCASYQVCDMTCPYGSGGSNTTTVSVPPQPGTDGAGQGGDASGGASGGAPDSADAGSDQAGSGNAAPPTGSTSTLACPKDVGVCVATPAKVKADTQCKAFCAVATKCGGIGGGGNSSGGGGTTPATGTSSSSSSGGSSGSSSGSASAAPTDTNDKAGATPGGEPTDGNGKSDGEGGTPDSGGGSSEGDVPDAGGAPDKDPGGQLPDPVAQDAAACEFMCEVIKLEKIAEKEFQAAVTCTITAATKTCTDMEKDCAQAFKAADGAMKTDEDKLELAVAGGWGGASSATLSGGGGTKNVEDETNSGGQGGDTGTPASASAPASAGTATATSGCTAGLVPCGGSTSGATLLLFGLFAAVTWRRRLA